MDIGVISVRYARALLKSAADQKLEEQVYQEMMTIAKSYLEVPQLRHTIDNPMLSKDKKEGLLLAAAGEKPCQLTKNFIQLVLKEDRENVFVENSPLLPACRLRRSRKCVRWWRARLMELWSLRPR